MKILYLTNTVPWPVDNGKKMRIMSFLKSLRGHQVHLICLNSEMLDEPDYAPLLEQVTRLTVIESSARCSRTDMVRRIVFLPAQLPYTVLRFKSAAMTAAINDYLARFSPEAIICDGLHTSINLENTKNSLSILNEHNIEYLILQRYLQQERNLLKKLYALLEMTRLRRFEKTQWSHFNHCIVCSETDKKIVFESHRNAEVTVIPNTIDLSCYDYAGKEKPFNIAYMGGLDWHPNQDAVFYFYQEIYPKIKRMVPSVSFTIIGRNPPEHMVRIQEDDDTVKVTGTVPDVRPFLSACQVFAVPLRMGSGTRLKILEALAMKKPVVSTSIGAEGLNLKDRENVMLADNSEDFADRVIELMQNEDLRKNIASRGYEFVKSNYDTSIVRERLDEILARAGVRGTE